MADQDKAGEPPSAVVSSRFKIIETEGDVFAVAPDGAVLIHAVNCLGEWGSGIAKAFKSKYPAAFEVYKSHCDEKSKSSSRSELLPGTCLLIPPQVDDYVTPEDEGEASGAKRKRKRRKSTPAAEVKKKKKKTKKHWIACLFTSYGYGKRTKAKPGKDPPETIGRNTEEALRWLRAQVEFVDGSRLDAGTGRTDKDAARRSKAVGGRDAEGLRIGEDGMVDEDRASDEADRRATEPGREADSPGPLYACKFNSGSFGVEWSDTRALVEQVFEGSRVSVMYVVSPPPATGR